MNYAINVDPISLCVRWNTLISLYCMLNTACTIYQRKMYAHADLELQWLLLLFGETRVIFVLGNKQIWIKCRFPWIMTVTTILDF